MNIKITKNAGFCFGIKNALNIINNEAKNKNIQVFGDIAHNKRVVSNLKNKGIETIYNIYELSKEYVCITAHGLNKNIQKKLSENFKLIDATCPLVKVVYNKGLKLEQQNYFVIVFGDPNHVEVQGIVSNFKNYLVIFKEEDIDNNINKIKNKKIGCVCQTTMNLENVNKLLKKVKTLAKEVKFENTICNATNLRQTETKKLAKKVEIMIVIGGEDSANTLELKNISKRFTTTYHVQSYEDLKEEWFENITNVGITAGASTPTICIDEVYNWIKKLI